MRERLPTPPRRTTAALLRRARDAEIRFRCAAGSVTMSRLGRQFGVTDARIWQIVRGYRQERAHVRG